MLFIVIYHMLIHSIIPNNPNWDWVTLPAITSLHIGVICFVLISGYWGIHFSVHGFLKLVIQCVVYSVFIYLVYLFFNPERYNTIHLLKSFIPTQWWFVNVYVCLYLLAPIINIPLQTASRTKKMVYIALLGAVSFAFQFAVPGLSDGKNPLNFIFIYYIGNFIRHDLKISSNWSTDKRVWIYIMFNIMLFTGFFVLSDVKVLTNLFSLMTFPYNSIGLILNACLFFLIFRQIKLNSTLVNRIAVSMLPVYLLHENQYIGSTYLYPLVGKMQTFITNPVLFCISVVSMGILVVLAGVVIDKLISYVVRFIEKSLSKTVFFTKLHHKLNDILA